MRLKVLVPHKVFFNAEVDNVSAEGMEGSFSLRPNHIDYVSALTAGILTYKIDNEDRYMAHDEGVLVKNGDQVMISTYKAIKDRPLGELQKAIEKEIKELSDQEKKARSSLAMLEGSIIRKYTEQTHIK